MMKGLAVLVLLTTLTIRAPQDFSAFPTILLATTLTRLVLNVAATCAGSNSYPSSRAMRSCTARVTGLSS